MKTCTKCLVLKPTSGFYRNKKNSDGLFGTCKECHREACREWRADHKSNVADWQRRRLYDLAPGEFESMVQDQGGACASCGATDKVLVMDHNHKTGRKRQPICQSCNIKVGALESDKIHLVAIYLERHEQCEHAHETLGEP